MNANHPAMIDDDPAHRLEEMRQALDQAAIVAITDERGLITYVNDKFCEISRYSRDELIGQDHRIINSGISLRKSSSATLADHRAGGSGEANCAIAPRTGRLLGGHDIVPFLDAGGKPRQYLAIRSDITERKAVEARAARPGGAAQLGEFAAVVAHEVRNPLAGLRGSLQILAARLPGDMREREIIAPMIQRIDGLNKTVEDILLFARPQPARLTVRRISGPVIDEAAVECARGRSWLLGDVIVGRVDAIVQADPEMLRAVLLNLLLNAESRVAGRTDRD